MVVACRSTLGILHFTCPPIVGGVEQLIRLHCELLLRFGFDVRVFAGRGRQFNRRAPLQRITALDSKHAPLLDVNEELRRGQVTPKFERLVDELVTELRERLRGLEACIVHNALSLHFNLPLTAALARLIEEGEAPPLISWCHDLSWTNPLYFPLMRDRHPWNLLGTPLSGVKYVVVSEDRRRDLVELWGSRHNTELPTVVPAGVDPTAKLRLRRPTVELARQLLLHDARPFMLLPARITKRKNIEYAIRVTRGLRDLGLSPMLLVTGPPGPHNVRSVDYVDELREERRRLGVLREVVFLCEQRRSNGRQWRASDGMMDDLYQLADLLIFPSAQEGFGIPLVEAGLARLPIFCSDIPPFRELAGDCAHFFDLADSPSRVAERIAGFLDTDQMARMRRLVLKSFTWERIFAERILPILPNRVSVETLAEPVLVSVGEVHSRPPDALATRT